MTARRYSHSFDKSPGVEPDRDGDWRDDAFCKADPDTWFSDYADVTEEARKACLSCPVFVECAAYVKTVLPSDGVWAGRLWVNGRPVERNTRRPPNQPPPPADRLPVEHGTERGYQQHRQHKTAKCEPCKAAHAAMEADRARARRMREVEATRAILAEVAARSCA